MATKSARPTPKSAAKIKKTSKPKVWQPYDHFITFSRATRLLIVICLFVIVGGSGFLLGLSQAAPDPFSYSPGNCYTNKIVVGRYKNSKHACVRTAQKVLNLDLSTSRKYVSGPGSFARCFNAAYGKKAIVGVDQQFGAQTEKAVRCYQGAHGLKVDGVAGPDTFGSMAGICTAHYSYAICY